MSLHVFTDNPEELLMDIKRVISNNEIRTWMIDQDGDFSHDADNWLYRAWLRPIVLRGELVFGIISPKKEEMTKTVYGVYHGRFAEMLLTHFDTVIQEIRLSSMPTKYDSI